jgi:hypothetical protein
MITALLATATPSPIPTPDPTPVDPGRGGFLAVGLIIFLIIAVVILYRSMRRQMSKVSPDLPSGRDDDDSDTATPPRS